MSYSEGGYVDTRPLDELADAVRKAQERVVRVAAAVAAEAVGNSSLQEDRSGLPPVASPPTIELVRNGE
jgi:hypothetical protein